MPRAKKKTSRRDNDDDNETTGEEYSLLASLPKPPRRRRASAAKASYKEVDSESASSEGEEDESEEEDEEEEEATKTPRSSSVRARKATRSGGGTARRRRKRTTDKESDESEKEEEGDEESIVDASSPPPKFSSSSRKRKTATSRTKDDARSRNKVAVDVDVVLAKCRQLKRESLSQRREIDTKSASSSSSSSSSSSKKQSKPSDGDVAVGTQKRRVEDLRNATTEWGNVVEVSEMDSSEVMDGIERQAMRIAESILAKQGFRLDVPSRAASNQIYVPELDRIVLGDKMGSRSFLKVKESRKTAITTRVMQLLHQVLHKRIHITKRDLFYTDVKLFVDQSESDNVLDDVATMIGCTRSNLHVVASDKGLVVGRISFVEDGDPIDCTRMGVGGKAIPPYIDKITDIRSDAEFVLLVEKEAAYMRLAEDRFYHRYPCIVVTAKGQPDVATRMFLSRLKAELGLPVLGLVDADPYGLKILSVYMSGSKNMSYDSASLTCPDIKWLGLRPSDLNRYRLPEQCRLDMTENDIKTGKELLQEDFIQKNPTWMKELQIMVKTKKKAEIQALSSFGFQYITEEYLPRKLQEGDWL